LAARPISNIASIVKVTGITPATAGKVMAALENIGLVRELTGQKRNRVFAYTAYIELLNQEP
jgi:Fic family protein